LRVAFAGTPPFAATALEALLAAGFEIPLVLTQPDRPAGRGLKLTQSAVGQLARERGLAVEKPLSLREPQTHAGLATARADVLVVAAYGLILPQAVLDLPALGCLNIHASLLPRWRGAAPVQRALLAGDAETGVGIMRMEAGLDTGPVLLERRTPIGLRETAGELTGRLALLGAQLVVEALRDLPRLVARPQAASGASYAPKIAKAEARIDWNQEARVVDRQVRAFNPFPGAECRLAGEPLKVWQAEPAEGRGTPGTVLASQPGTVVVACGQGALRLQVVQRPGSRRLEAAEFLRGTPLPPGTVL
jgi:methionyl-tRNA formyltransferase